MLRYEQNAESHCVTLTTADRIKPCTLSVSPSPASLNSNENFSKHNTAWMDVMYNLWTRSEVNAQA